MKESPALALINRNQLKKLYDRIGSQEKLVQILEDFYRRMAGDVLLDFFFAGRDTDQIAARQAEFLLKAMGVVQEYRGKRPPEAHAPLPPILQGHFDRRLRILEETLKDHGIEDEHIRTWVAFEKAFEDVVVTR